MTGLFEGLTVISLCLGWLSLLIGAVWSTVEVLREPEHTLGSRSAIKT